MDEVDRRYFDNIRDALNSKNVDKLLSVCTSMSEEEAANYITKWNDISNNMMEKIRASIDTTEESQELYDILYGICEKYPLSGNTIHRYR